MCSEAEFAFGETFFDIPAYFFNSLKILGDFWEAIGTHFGRFWGAKIRANFERIFETFFSNSQGGAVTSAVAG